jgi:repressor LexA
VLNFIRDLIRSRGYGPTVREIGSHFRIRSPNGVMCHLRALEKKGIIVREPNMSRAIQLAEAAGDLEGLPLVGRVAAGVLHEAIEQNERINFNSLFRRCRAIPWSTPISRTGITSSCGGNRRPSPDKWSWLAPRTGKRR